MAKYDDATLKQIYLRIIRAMSGFPDIDVDVGNYETGAFSKEAKLVKMPSSIHYAKDDERDFTLGRGILIHEGCHVLFLPNAVPTKRKLEGEERDAESFWMLVNIFADCNNEYKTAKVFPHFHALLKYCHEAVVEDSKGEILKGEHPFIQIFCKCLKKSEMLDSEAPYPTNYDADFKEFVEITVKEYESEKIRECSGKKMVAFTLKTFERWEKLAEAKSKGGSKADKKKMQELMKKLGQAIEAKDEKAEDELNKKISELGKKMSKGLPGLDKKLIPIEDCEGSPYEDMTLAELRKMLNQKHEKVETDSDIPGWGTCDKDSIKQVKQIRPEPNNYKHEDCDLNQASKDGLKINRELRKKIKLLEDFEIRHRAGRLDMNEVRRQISQMGQITSPACFERTYTNHRRGGEWAVEVIMDCSGSMAGQKMIHAKQCFATLAFAFDKIPNIHYALTGFEQKFDMIPYDVQVKRFNDGRLDTKKLQWFHSGCGNCDGHHIRTATQRLLKFRNIKKLLVVISDAQPAYENGIDDTANAVKFATRFGIKVIGVGVERVNKESFEHIYPIRYYAKTETFVSEMLTLILGSLGQIPKTNLLRRKIVL